MLEQRIQYEMDTKLREKERQVAALTIKLSTCESLMDAFETNYRAVKNDIEEVHGAFGIEREAGTLKQSDGIALTAFVQ